VGFFYAKNAKHTRQVRHMQENETRRNSEKVSIPEEKDDRIDVTRLLEKRKGWIT